MGLWNIAVSGVILALGTVLVFRWLAVCGVPFKRISLPPAGTRVAVSPGECAKVFGGALLFRVLVFGLAAALATALGVMGARNPVTLWERWDGLHYVRLAELGYGGYVEDGQHLFLVFFPLYVWLIRLLGLVVPNTAAAGLAVSWLCYAGGCVYLYCLAALDYGRETAVKAIWFLSIFPYSFFFGGIMTEGLFLLTTAAGLYAIRRHRWWEAGVWGILAALTRMHGLLLIGAALAELVQEAKLFSQRREGLRAAGKRILRCLPAVFLPVLGTAIYFVLNWRIDDNPFAFTVHQRHWSQGFCWISKTLGYIVKNTLSYPNKVVQLELWLPTLLLFILFFAGLWSAERKHRSMYTLYAFACLFLDYSLSWLLSAGRYLSCALPFFLFLGVWARGKPKRTAAVSIGMLALSVVILSRFLSGGQIM
ncbi:hypothetical protein D1159_08390 [Pseudoflavonifractor sp. 524-17]|uniref:mannosyltransferase family protein n=1 Tax=Pseudoflavonifractor sp. 524-17 TaxID=2304577 RepID=UPI00137B7754|nr:mannosyltransferase family protein [Pseudoflavonifractor sp. 524-17]NCE64604.1 hypothetical protein [Pseudoflavonifractor sp. 524-17]